MVQEGLPSTGVRKVCPRQARRQAVWVAVYKNVRRNPTVIKSIRGNAKPMKNIQRKNGNSITPELFLDFNGLDFGVDMVDIGLIAPRDWHRDCLSALQEEAA